MLTLLIGLVVLWLILSLILAIYTIIGVLKDPYDSISNLSIFKMMIGFFIWPIWAYEAYVIYRNNQKEV